MMKDGVIYSEANAAEIAQQEQSLRFPSFSRQDAMALAQKLVQKSMESAVPAAIMIEHNGLRVFQYFPEGTGEINRLWMESKIKTVKILGKSTMRVWAESEARGLLRKPTSLTPDADVAFCGGGFPIHVQNVGIVGQIAVSGPGDQQEHDLIVQTLYEYLHQSSDT